MSTDETLEYDHDQLRRLLEGVDEWNQWRDENPDVGIRLSSAPLREAHLENAKLWTAHLENATLYCAHLKNARLKLAHLENANLVSAHLENANLWRAHLEKANLAGAHLENADLSGAHLENANLWNAHLERAVLRGAHLENANLRDAHLENADLSGAHLENASLRDAHLENADLKLAHLENADLEGADLSSARLERVNLSRAELRGLKGLVLDDCFIRDTRFSPRAPDPWSVLRRQYTGLNFVLMALLVAAFFLPYVATAFGFVGVQKAQPLIASVQEQGVRQLRSLSGRIRAQAEQLNPATDACCPLPAIESVRGRLLSTAATLDDSANQIGSIGKCLAPNCLPPMPVWQALLGAHRGPMAVGLSILLLIYNVLRGFLTYRVVRLREVEERSGYSPALKDYRQLHRLHYVVFALMFLAISAALHQAWDVLVETTVVLPAP